MKKRIGWMLSLMLILGTSAALAGSGAFLGVLLKPLGPELKEELGYGGRGVYIPQVVEDGAAAEAGVKDGDVLVELDGETLAGPGHLQDLLGFLSPGEKVKLMVWRDGKTRKLTAELAERPVSEAPEAEVRKDVYFKMNGGAWLGVVVQTLTDQLREHFEVPRGVLLAEVAEDSPAQQAGLKAGDVLLAVDDQEMEEADDLTAVIRDHEPGDPVEIRLHRDGQELMVKATLGETPEEFQNAWTKLRRWTDADGDEMVWHGSWTIPPIPPIPPIPEIELDFHHDMKEFKADLEELRKELEELKENLRR